MDPEVFLDVANQVTKLKMYPYFDIAHAALCSLHVREDLGSGKGDLLRISFVGNSCNLDANLLKVILEI